MAESTGPAQADTPRRGYHIEIFLISFAGLLLEVSYTRIISFKLFYYYTFLVIGLALLGIASGGVLVAISRRMRRASTDAILMWSLLLGAASVGVGYLIVAVTRTDSLTLWDYGTSDSLTSLARLVLICLVLFASFIAVGVVLATLFGRRSDEIGRLYFADLVGAGLACAVVVWLLGSIGPPATILLAGLIMAGAGVRIAVRRRSRVAPVGAVMAVLLAVAVVAPSVLPYQRTDESKADLRDSGHAWDWSAVFRVDAVAAVPNALTLIHDGNEVLASLYFDAGHIDAVELNPVTYRFVTQKFADYDGHFTDNPKVNYVNDEGRGYLARSDRKYGLIWYLGRERPVRELPLHERSDRRQLRPPAPRWDPGGQVRRVRLRRPAEPHDPLRRHRPQGARRARRPRSLPPHPRRHDDHRRCVGALHRAREGDAVHAG